MNKDPLRIFTRGIADAVERTPAFDAMVSGKIFIPTTWGDLASRAVEQGVVEPTIAAVCDYLMIKPENLNDPTLQFTNDYPGGYLRKLHEKWQKDYCTENGESAQAFENYILEASTKWTIEDNKEKSQDIQRQIDDVPDSNEEKAHQESMLLCMKRDAYWSGIAVNAIEFLNTALTYSEDYPTGIQSILNAFEATVDRVSYNFRLSPDTPLADIILEKDDLDTFLYCLKNDFDNMSERYANEQFHKVRHLFYSPEMSNHSLFVGNEK